MCMYSLFFICCIPYINRSFQIRTSSLKTFTRWLCSPLFTSWPYSWPIFSIILMNSSTHLYIYVQSREDQANHYGLHGRFLLFSWHIYVLFIRPSFASNIRAMAEEPIYTPGKVPILKNHAQRHRSTKLPFPIPKCQNEKSNELDICSVYMTCIQNTIDETFATSNRPTCVLIRVQRFRRRTLVVTLAEWQWYPSLKENVRMHKVIAL